MRLAIGIDVARAAFDQSVGGFLAAVGGLTEYELLGHSRCHGWSRLDVVSHVVGGWHEMLGGLASPVEDEPTVDAASYWTAFAAESSDQDPVTTLMSQRRRSDAYPRPAAACAHLNDVAAALRNGVRVMPDRPYLWQGHVFTAGDFLAVWAVEDAVHHLDLDAAGDLPPASALSLARRTIEALIGQDLPPSWSDVDAVLIGTGRLPVPAGQGALRDKLPAIR